MKKIGTSIIPLFTAIIPLLTALKTISVDVLILRMQKGNNII
jgi:hypothetical protein